MVPSCACCGDDVKGRSLIHGIVIALLSVSGCSSDGVLDNDDLSSLLSISNVTRTRIADTANPALISGLTIDSTVIHTGFVTVRVPFRMTWALRRDGAVLATATRDFGPGFSPGDSIPVRLTLRFGPVSDLVGTTDSVTFDILGDAPNSILGV